MKKLFLVVFVLVFALSAKSQILKPVTWAYAFKKLSATEAIVYVKATIDNGWHVYSQNIKEGGPVKTTFNFAKSPNYTLIGNTAEPKPIVKFEKTFDMDVAFFEKTVMFSQKIKLKGKTALVKGTVEFMTCDDHQCLPPEEVAFAISVK
ncbi:MAG: protein-disulfide reductase DsbD domain-containing protein [Bacteroidota bacterium]